MITVLRNLRKECVARGPGWQPIPPPLVASCLEMKEDLKALGLEILHFPAGAHNGFSDDFDLKWGEHVDVSKVDALLSEYQGCSDVYSLPPYAYISH